MVLLPRLCCPISIYCLGITVNCLWGRRKRCRFKSETCRISRWLEKQRDGRLGDVSADQQRERSSYTYFCSVSLFKKAFSQHPAHSTHICAFPPPSLVSLRINTHSPTCTYTHTHTQMHLDGRCVVFLWCANNCNCVFKQQVAQRTKNSTVSCGAEMLSLRRGGERRRMKSRGRCTEDGEDGKRSPAPLDFKFLMQSQLLEKTVSQWLHLIIPLLCRHEMIMSLNICGM